MEECEFHKHVIFVILLRVPTFLFLLNQWTCVRIGSFYSPLR